MRTVALLGLFAIAGCAEATPPRAPAPAAPAAIVRGDFVVPSEPGVEIAVHEVSMPGVALVPVLFVHGAGLGAPSFDLPVPGYSLAEDLARAGHPTYALDVRGWGRSTRPASFGGDPSAAPPAVSSDEAVRDIAAVVDEIRRRRGASVALVGWATGGHWAAMYAASHRDTDRVVMINALYGVPGAWPLREALEEPGAPGTFRRAIGAFAFRDGKSLIGRWEASIPGDDKDRWRDPRVAAAYVAAAIASDPTSRNRQPNAVRVASGPLRDSYLLAIGTRMWDAAAIAAPVLVVRGELDFWSRPEDVEALGRELRSPASRVVTIPGATHFVFLDRPEHGRARLVEELRAFLAAPSPRSAAR